MDLSATESLAVARRHLIPTGFPTKVALVVSVGYTSSSYQVVSKCRSTYFRRGGRYFQRVSPRDIVVTITRLIALVAPLPVEGFSHRMAPVICLATPLCITLLIQLDHIFSRWYTRPIYYSLTHGSLLVCEASTLSYQFGLQ